MINLSRPCGRRSSCKSSYFPVLNGCFERSALTKWSGGIKLLRTVAFGDEIYLKGPTSIKPPSYTSETIDFCLKPQRALAQSLLNQVFNKKENLAYLRDPTDIGKVGTRIKLQPGTFRGTKVTFRALDLPDSGFYSVQIVGSKGCDTHRFRFEPSIKWACSRFPENCS